MLGGEGPYVKLEQAKATCYCEFLGIESLPQIKEFPLEITQRELRRVFIMYAVIKSGGKQHRVEPGEVLRVEKLDLSEGDKIDFDEVMMVGDEKDVQIGSPYVEGGKVSAEVVGHGRGDKVTIIKMRRRKHYRRQAGHRQYYTEIKILDIAGGK